MCSTSARRSISAQAGNRTYHIVKVPHSLYAGRTKVAGNDPLNARVERRLEDRFLRGDCLCCDRAQEGVDTLQVLCDLGGRICGVVTDANLDAAGTQCGYVRLGRTGRAREGSNVLRPRQRRTLYKRVEIHSHIGQFRGGHRSPSCQCVQWRR